jgi:HSP20 family molecular chaperone IbpA
MSRVARQITPELKTEITRALSEWVNSLSSAEAKRIAMNVSGVEFTALQILDAVKNETDFGKKFLAGLFDLHCQVIEDQPGASIVDLIRRTVQEPISAGGGSPLREDPSVQEPLSTEVPRLPVDDYFLERVHQIDALIAKRAYELFASSGSMHGRDLEHWLRAEAELLRSTALDVSETEAELTIRAHLPGLSSKDLAIRVGARRLFITRRSPERFGQTEGQFGPVLHVLTISETIGPGDVTAVLSSGILEVRLRKTRAVKKRSRKATAS